MLQVSAVASPQRLVLELLGSDEKATAAEEQVVEWEVADHLEGCDTDSIRPSGSSQNPALQTETGTQDYPSACL